MRLSHLTTNVKAQNEAEMVSRRLSRRRKLLQLLGAVLIALAGVAEIFHISEPTLRATPLFFLTLGIIVLVSGLGIQRSSKSFENSN
jgi:hypothetical protein